MILAMSQELLQREVVMGLAALVCYVVFTCYLLPKMEYGYGGAIGLLCPTSVVLIAVVVEKRPLGQVLDWHHQSWAFLLGDFILLVIASTLSSKLWQQLPKTREVGRRIRKTFWRRWRWVVICLVFGVVVALYIHERDVTGYAAAGSPASAFTASKLVHDVFGSSIYPAVLAFTGLPVLVVPLLPHYCAEQYDNNRACRFHWEHLIIALCIVGFGLLMVLDGFRNLDPALLHPPRSG